MWTRHICRSNAVLPRSAENPNLCTAAGKRPDESAIHLNNSDRANIANSTVAVTKYREERRFSLLGYELPERRDDQLVVGQLRKARNRHSGNLAGALYNDRETAPVSGVEGDIEPWLILD